MALLDLSGEASIVLCGAAGQGVQTVEQLLMRILLKSGYHVFSTSEFMSRIRGGSNSTEIRVAGHPVDAFVNRIDILVAFHRDAIAHLRHRISADTLILGEEEAIGPAAAEGRAALPVPFTQIATEVGNRIYANTVAVGALAGMLSVDPQLIADYVAHVFASRTEQIISDNKEAVRRGYEIGHEFVTSGKLSVSIPKAASGRRLLLSGTEAVSLGAVAGGCNFISSYPMSPATGVLTYLAQHGAELGMVAEQAEDEISAINMALGASYAGARAMVTTSGGGFALMEEGVSLAGAAELPVVIHLSQRPGPATGLPTRTEQGDLLMALHSGHGEFPRIILAPGTAQDAFYLTQSAFNLADKHQVPVFVLTDQYLVDSSYAVPDLDLEALKVERHIVETDAGYGRYRVTDDGVSPRGVPGFGAGLAVPGLVSTAGSVLLARAEVARTAAGCLVHSQHAADLLAADCGVAAVNVGPLPMRPTVPVGVAPIEPPAGDAPVLIVTAGVADTVKQTHRFVAAAELLLERRPAWRAAVVGLGGERFVGDGSPVALGTVSLAQAVAFLAFSLIGGSVVDRYPKRRVLFVTQSLLMGLAAAMAVLTATGATRDSTATPALPLADASSCTPCQLSPTIPRNTSSGARTSCRQSTSGARSASHFSTPRRCAARIPLTFAVAILSTPPSSPSARGRVPAAPPGGRRAPGSSDGRPGGDRDLTGRGHVLARVGVPPGCGRG